VVGPEGSGKTFTCDEIEKMIQTKDYPIEVLRPTIPIDFMGASLGETEDIIASIFGLARQCRKCILLLDDIDQLLYEKDAEAVGSENGTMPHSQTRIISSFLSHMDSLRMNPSSKADHLLIIGTASNIRVDSIGRIDKVFFLEPPNHTERRAIIVESLGVSSTNTVTATLLADLVDCTVGRSRSELVQYCRQALSCCSVAVIMNVSSEVPSTDEILATMKKNLQSLAPESLRTLFGNNASQVWNGLRSLIVMPLCQSNALDDMLFGSSEHNGKTVCGGVLLAGQPGCGKSALAYHCASVAASLLPSVTLLDVSCTSLVHKEVGGSERALRRLFVSARAAAPCILLMDGIENIAAVRGHDNTTEGTMDRILSTLLVELDGIESQSDNAGKIAVIGITHNEQWIDPALRRPGRLEKVLKLGNPDFDARVGIVQQEIDSLVVRDSEKELANFVATRTDGMSGAEVVALCKEARMESARKYIHENIELGEVDLSISREHFFTAGLQR
jgi:transitional endoplasmic reticulum ATPase